MKKIILIVIIILCFLPVSVTALNPSFATQEIGSNIICTSTSSGTITRYKWSITLNNSEIGTTGWITDNTIPTYYYTFQDGGWIIIELCIGNATDTACATQSLGFISGLRDVYPAEHYQTCKLCEDAGYYWYNNSCHEHDEELPWNIKKPLQGAEPEIGEYEITIGEYTIDFRLILIFFVFAILYLIFKKR